MQELKTNVRSRHLSVKLLFLVCAATLFGLKVNARPEYLKLFAADPASRPDLRNKCSVCHINPAGGGPRNEFGKAFTNAGFEITPALRTQFPDYFVSQSDAQKPAVTFVEGSDSEAIVEINGKKFTINTRTKTVTPLESAGVSDRISTAAPAPSQVDDSRQDIYKPYDVRLVNIPTAMPITKGSLWSDFTHRFPFGDPTNSGSLFGLDTIALPSFGFAYGVTDRIHVGFYRSPGDIGRPIQLYAGASLLNEQKGDPLSLMARVGLEGQDNFKRNFATSFEFTAAKSITKHAQVYFVPTITVGDRPINGDPTVNLPGTTAYAMGVGLAVAIRPTVSLMADMNYRLNEEARYVTDFSGIRRPVYGFGIQKVSASRKHAFSLTFSNGPGTTMSQRSMTRGVQGLDDSARGLSIGFNLSRRLF
jgi:hypothetical protein